MLSLPQVPFYFYTFLQALSDSGAPFFFLNTMDNREIYIRFGTGQVVLIETHYTPAGEIRIRPLTNVAHVIQGIFTCPFIIQNKLTLTNLTSKQCFTVLLIILLKRTDRTLYCRILL